MTMNPIDQALAQDILEFIEHFEFVNDRKPTAECLVVFSNLDPFLRLVEIEDETPEWAREDYPSKEGWE